METTLAEPVNHQSRTIRSEQLPPTSPAAVCGDEHKPKHKFCGGYLETNQQKQVRWNTLSVVCETRTRLSPVLSLLPIAVPKLRSKWTRVGGAGKALNSWPHLSQWTPRFGVSLLINTLGTPYPWECGASFKYHRLARLQMMSTGTEFASPWSSS